MDISVPASEANRSFSELLRRVQNGESVSVTRHGRPVARIIPAEDDGAIEERRQRQERARAYLKRAAKRPAVDIGPWTRDELYDR
jgi:prevent-host-death family protein